MVSVERPSEIGTPQWNGPQQRPLHFALDTAEVDAYYEKGFLILREVFQPTEIETYRQEAEQIVARAFALSREFQLEPKYNLRFEILADGQPWKIDPFVSISPLFSALARDRRIMDRLASLYDGYEAVLFKDKLIFKPPDSHGNGLHQDYNWWQGFPHSLLTVSVALDASTKENGCTELWTGHHQGFLHEPGSLDKGSIDPEHLANEEHIYVDLAPGDMAIFTCFTPHAAASNKSNSARRMLFLSYNDSRDGEHYTAHYEHFRSCRTRPDHMADAERSQCYF
ncbi:MAG: phytanoyl-CoA dioxygenase family protein, partial [Candidatus Poribacteria bacterium]|nr:phytanoyl-CoA dioxygenase family protein [Candidatus Poribacteria bacterium]